MENKINERQMPAVSACQIHLPHLPAWALDLMLQDPML